MTDSTIIDRSALKNLLEMIGGDTSFLGQGIDTYLADSDHLLATIRAATDSGNATELRRAAHSLKSNSANFGATVLSAICQELEEIGKGGSVDGASQKLAALEAEFGRAKSALSEIRSSGM